MAKKIKLDNLAAIQDLINEAEGKVTCRWMSVNTVVYKVKKWENNVYNPPKSTLIGVSLKIQACGGTVAKAYKYIPMETVVCLEHGTVGWYVVKAAQTKVSFGIRWVTNNGRNTFIRNFLDILTDV